MFLRSTQQKDKKPHGWDGHKNLLEGQFQLDIRKEKFTMKGVKHWNRGPERTPEMSPSLETFKIQLGMALSNLM